jgi:hypothetical protein
VTATAAVVEAGANGQTVVNLRGLALTDAPTLADQITSIVQFRTIQNPSLSASLLTSQLVTGLVKDGLLSSADANSTQAAVLQNVVTPVATDTTSPSCELTNVGTNPQGQKFIQVTVQDSDDGLGSVVLTTLTNATAGVGTYQTGITTVPTSVATPDHPTTPVVVTATKLDQNLGAQLALTVTDVAGNVTNCDPVLAQLSKSQATQIFRNIPQAESKITIENGRPGYRQVRALVNGHSFALLDLRAGEVRTIDASSAMKPGNVNTIIVRASGPPNATADVLIWDGKGALPKAAVTNTPGRHAGHLQEKGTAPADQSRGIVPANRIDELIRWSGGEERLDPVPVPIQRVPQ